MTVQLETSELLQQGSSTAATGRSCPGQRGHCSSWRRWQGLGRTQAVPVTQPARPVAGSLRHVDWHLEPQTTPSRPGRFPPAPASLSHGAQPEAMPVRQSLRQQPLATAPRVVTWIEAPQAGDASKSSFTVDLQSQTCRSTHSGLGWY